MPMLSVLPTNVRNILANLRKHNMHIMALESTPMLLVFNAFSDVTILVSSFDSFEHSNRYKITGTAIRHDVQNFTSRTPSSFLQNCTLHSCTQPMSFSQPLRQHKYFDIFLLLLAEFSNLKK